MDNTIQFGKPLGPPSVLTIGSFDGVHLGHQAILNLVLEEAKKFGYQSIVASFDPHPREVLFGDCPELLAPGLERTELLAAYPIDSFTLIRFDKALAQKSAYSFVRDVIVGHFNAKTVVIGYDHRFGHDRRGDVHLLHILGAELGFSVVECGKVEVDGSTASSSSIRDALLAGNVGLASSLLGRFYSLSGTVVHGDGRGKRIGIATANIGLMTENKLKPANGVYAVKAEVSGYSKRFSGMMNIGTRPTFDGGSEIRLEVHLFEFDQDAYDREVRVEFVERIRDERKFESLDALIQQLNVDRDRCTELLRKIA